MENSRVFYLVLQFDYQSDGIQAALFRGEQMLVVRTLAKIEATAQLMLVLVAMLEEQELSWIDLSFIGANLGPGPFSTLRAVIATVNGIGFATKLPLIGVDGLRTFAKEMDCFVPRNDDNQGGIFNQQREIYEKDRHCEGLPEAIQKNTVVILLNAYGGDVYYAIKTVDSYRSGCENGQQFLERLKSEVKGPTLFVGNVVSTYQAFIETIADAHIPDLVPQGPTLQAIAHQAYVHFQENKKGSEQLLPLYLKTIAYKTSCC